MEDDLSFFANGRRTQFSGKGKTTSIFGEIEDNLIFVSKLEDDLNFNVHGRHPQYQGKVKMT